MKSRFPKMNLRSLATAVGGLVLAAASQAQVIDFSSARGAGTSQSDVLVENIRLLVPVPNPFQPGSNTTVETSYSVLFRFDPVSLHLVPAGLVQTGGDGTALCASANVSVFDAVRGSGYPIANASVTLGRQTVQTNAQGVASFAGLPASLFAVSTAAANYVAATQTTALSCAAVNNITVALSPSGTNVGGLGAGKFRAILTWGENPRDLDSHLTGPAATGTDRWHVYYSAKTAGDMCGLDVDDTTSFGPETITCPRTADTTTTLRPGVYRYSVHHYAGTGLMSASGANVRLEFASGQSYTFTPPAGSYLGANDVWTVFEVTVGADGSQRVAPVNTITNSTSSSAVRSTGGTVSPFAEFGAAERADLFRNLSK